MQALNSKTVTYSRGSDSVEISATAGLSEQATLSPGTVITRTDSRDYIITAAELILAGAVTVPQRGDTIKDGDLTCEVTGEDDDPPFSYTTQSRKRFRVKTKVIQDAG